MDREALTVAHRHSSRHRDEISRSVSVGCFYCAQTYPAVAIAEWWDDDQTAVCPKCGIDSVIGDASGLPVTDEAFLEAMHKRWFERTVSLGDRLDG